MCADTAHRIGPKTYICRPLPEKGDPVDALEEHTIPFAGLKDGAHEFQFELGRAFFDEAADDDMEDGRIAVNARLEKSSTMLIANIRLEGTVALSCDHCNTPMDAHVEGEQRQIFQLHAGEDPDDEELACLPPDSHSVNLTHYLYECLRLALPARRVHAPGQCDPEVERILGGLTVAHEPAPDPRWSALNKLKNPRP